MATITDKSYHRAIGLPDVRAYDASALDATESTYTEAGPLTGVPADQDGSDMVLKATGSQITSSALRIQTKAGGYPGHIGGSYSSWPATAIWQRSGDTDWLGWDPPVMMTNYEVLATQSSPNPSLLTMATGSIMLIIPEDSGSGATIKASVYDADTNTWGGAVSIGAPSIQTYNAYCDVVQLASGRVIAFIVEQTSGGEFRMWARYSDDEGATWATLIDRCTLTSPAMQTSVLTPHRFRVEHNQATGDFLALLWCTEASGTFTASLLQFASTDGGSSWEQIQYINAASDDNQSATGDVVVAGGFYVVVSANPTATTAASKGYHVWRLANASQVISDTSSIRINSEMDLSGLGAADNRCALAVDDRGVIWFYGAEPGATIDREFCAFSQNFGTSWTVPFSGAYDNTEDTGSWYQPGVATVYPTDYAATFQRGRMLIACTHESPTTTGDDNDLLSGIWLGGYTTVTMPWIDSPLPGVAVSSRTPTFTAGWGINWVPFELPDNDGWTFASAGTFTKAISNGLLETTATVGRSYFQLIDASVTLRKTVRFKVTPNSGDAHISLFLGDGTNVVDALVRVGTTDIELSHTPFGANTTIGSIGSHSGGPIEGFVTIENAAVGNVALWWRSADTSEEKTWNKISGTCVTRLAPDNTRVRWGVGVLGNTTADADWYELHWSGDEEAGLELEDFANPDDLQGVPYGATEDAPTYIGDGVSVYGVDGPTYGGEDWHINTRYQHAIGNIFPGTVASPSIGWRSANTSSDVTIAFSVTGESGENSAPLGLPFLYLGGTNARTVTVGVYDEDTTSWTTVLTANNYIEVDYDRYGDSVIPDLAGAAANAPYLELNELVGGYFEFSTTKIRPIARNTNGNWIEGVGDGRDARIYVDDIDGTEPTAGTGKIWFPNMFLTWTPYIQGRVRIQIAGVVSGGIAPPDGYFKIGTMLFGWASVFGHDYSRERSFTISPNTTLDESRDGRRRSRVNGAVRRAVTFQWPQVDVTAFRSDGQPSTIEIAATGGTDYASTIKDDPLRWHGICQELRGSDRLCVYVPKLNSFTATSETAANNVYNQGRARGVILGRMIGGVTLTSAPFGEEGVDDGLQIGSVTIEEEL